jgi:hypothetical protein
MQGDYEIGPAVVSRSVEDEIVIVDLNSEAYFGLDRVGSVVWAGLEQRKPVPEIVQGIVDRFDVAPARAGRDVERLLGELVRAGLVRRLAP